MAHTDPLELAIRKELGRVYLCTLDELSALLDRFPAAQVAATVERLTGEGAIACRNSDASRCILWLPPTRAGRRGFEESPTAETPDSGFAETHLAPDAWTASAASSGKL